MTTRRERMEARLERRQTWAAKARDRSEQSLAAVRSLANQIPVGQPILVGHHSERRARRDAGRIHSGMSRGVEELRLAQRHEARAEGIERQLDSSIYSDDPDAVERLRERIAEAEAERDAAISEHARWLSAACSALAEQTETLARAETELGKARSALGEAWLAGGVSLAEGIRAKTRALERLGDSDLLAQARELLAGCVDAMQAWGQEEDGVPEGGTIGEAYDAAVTWLARLSPISWPEMVEEARNG